jgi:hypothetical protein
MGINVASELLAFAREIKQKELTNDMPSKAEPTKLRSTSDRISNTIPSSISQCNTSYTGSELEQLQNAGTDSRGNLSEDL